MSQTLRFVFSISQSLGLSAQIKNSFHTAHKPSRQGELATFTHHNDLPDQLTNNFLAPGFRKQNHRITPSSQQRARFAPAIHLKAFQPHDF
jgi:hypothetical protein